MNPIPPEDHTLRYVKNILKEAVTKKASDIHIEPYKNGYRIRFRLDGLLHPMTLFSVEAAQRIITCLKVMARLDISERRLPQDGRFTEDAFIFPDSLSSERKKDFRINIWPTLLGEKTVIRILDREQTSLQVEELGLEPLPKEIFLQALKKPQGLIIVTGPTGSGKTTTLYSALSFLNQTEKNICTVEDPVEIVLAGVNQMNVDPKIGLTFGKSLRAVLRQDPDVLMIGEIRDQETAETAIHAAQTGHLVLSTLHTNSAVETIGRLFMLGITAFNVAHTVQLIIAQRLVRQLCVHCKTRAFSESEFRAQGCADCFTGYRDRLALFELIPINAEVGQLIVENQPLEKITHLAQEMGLNDLRASGLLKVAQGVTTLSEITRVLL